MFRKFFMYYSPDGASGGGSTEEPTVEQLQQQLREISAKFELLNSRVEKGELVDPAAYIKAQTEAGELYPKARFTGLQQTFQAEQEAHKRTKETLNQLTASDMDLKAKFAGLETQFGTLQDQLKSKEAEIAGLASAKARATKIMKDFPSLAPFEAKGLLPQGKEEELDVIFAAFSEQIGSIQKQAQADFATGGSDTSPASKESKEPKAIAGSKLYLTQANAALSKGNVQEYNENYDNYLKALQTEKAGTT